MSAATLGGSAEILVVEDSPTQAEQLVYLLEEAGHTVISARDGAAALELYRERRPTLVVTDVVMPRMDGYELCRAIKGDDPQRATPVILLTSLASPEDVVDGLACGADNFVRKPYEPASLLARVDRCLAVAARRRGRVHAGAAGRGAASDPHQIRADREQVLDFLFSTFEETVHLDGELTRSYHSLDLLYRLAEGLNRCATEREVVVEVLARALELPQVLGAWIEIEGGRLAGASGVCSRVEDLSEAPAPDTTIELRSGDRRLGTLQLLGPDAGRLGDDELHTLEGVGNQVGAALERAMLQEHLEGRVQERTAALTSEMAARRRAESALRALAAIVESADDAMVRQDLDGRIETWNPGATRLYGYLGDEAVGQSIELVVRPDRVAETHDMLARVAAGHSVQGFETLRVTRDGTEVEVSLTLSPVRDANGQIVAVAEIARDITAGKALERQLLQSQKLESVGRLAGGIAHDFNNLMTAVIGFSELAIPRLATEDPVRGYVEEVKRAGERATALTQRLLAFGRRQVARPEVLDLNAVVRELETLLMRLLGDDVELVVELAEGAGALRADRSQLEQIVMNLAINARDAMPGGGRLTIATVAPATGAERLGLDPRQSLGLRVTDTGTGMDADTRSQIFEPFFTTKPEGKGTGLGLSTVFGIVRQSDGAIAVDSEPGRGSTFTVYLPRARQAVVSEPRPGLRAAPEPGSERVLVVEDEDGVRSLLRRVLEQAGYDVEVADGPAAALARDRSHIDLLITDMLMPGMNGRELAERIRELSPRTRTLYISGYAGEAIAGRGLLAAGARFLSKPFTPRQLLEQVRAVLDES